MKIHFFKSLLASVLLLYAINTATGKSKTIGYIPLDDRPVNYERVIWLCKAAGFDILIPEKELIGTKLDNMDPYPDGRTSGDRVRILDWLKQSEGKCDYYIISADQLLSGGLVASRWLSNTDLSFEYGLCDYLIQLSKKYPVLVFDTIMRLASTNDYQGYKLEEYSKFITYGGKNRYILEDKSLNPDNIAYYYDKDPHGHTIDSCGLTGRQIKRYFDSRKRKLLLSDKLLTGNENYLYYYLGVDDSSPNNTIQTNEINYFKNKLKNKNGMVSIGTDELGVLGIAFIAAKEYPGTKVHIEYFGGKEHEYADPYNYLPLNVVIDNKLKFLNISKTDGEEDLNILILTRSDNYTQAINALIDKAKSLISRGKAVCIIDPNSNFQTSDHKTSLGKFIIDSGIPLLELMGYSSWNTAANSTGIGLANGIARYSYLQNSTPSPESNDNFIALMTFSYLKDISYKSCRFCSENDDPQIPYSFPYVLNKLNDSDIVTNFDNFKTIRHKTISVSKITNPWNRPFELLFEIKLD